VSSFTSAEILISVPVNRKGRAGRREAVVQAAFVYEVGEEGSGERITVPAGYVTDFASVPRLFWRVEPPFGIAAPAAVVHDYLYSSGGLEGRYTRLQADEIFREALAVLGVGVVKRNLMFAAVRVGGGSGFGR
jgi:hypothetical protein